LSLTTLCNLLVDIKDFYRRLSDQQGYKRKVDLNTVEYFTLNREQTRMAKEKRDRPIPTLEAVKQVVASITGESEVDMRDRAMLSYAMLIGPRIDAIASISLGAVNLMQMSVIQDPEQGVRTKLRKKITTKIIVRDEQLIAALMTWVTHLRETRGFVDRDPLFPRTSMRQRSFDDLQFVARSVGREYWKNGNMARNVFQRRFKEAGMKYFNPHSFRSAAIKAAIERCTTPMEVKAVSQNFGHEDVRTTFNYIKLPPEELAKILENLSSPQSNDAEDLISEIDAVVRRHEKNRTKGRENNNNHE
jgi:integrase